ncbi:MAG: DUF1003 domain-containing protein [Thermomicrobiales bacterium]
MSTNGADPGASNGHGNYADGYPWALRSADDAPDIPDQQLSMGQRIADRTTIVLGSWIFIFVQMIVVGIWILLNMVAFVQHWDPYPFIFLNLAFSFQSAIVAPIILMSQNRQDEQDRVRDQAEFAVNTRAGRNVREVRARIDTLSERQTAAFQQLQDQQAELLARINHLNAELQRATQGADASR